MAQRNFSSTLRISAIADITIFLLVIHAAGILSQHLSVNAARNIVSMRIDDGGIKVPTSLPGHAREIIAIRNQPLTLQCPVNVTEDVKILDMWWMKDGEKLDLYPTTATSSAGQPNQNQYNSQQLPLQQQQQTQIQTTTQAQYSNVSNNNSSIPPLSSLSTTSSSSLTSPVARVVITNEGDLHFEKINHKVTSFGQRHKNYSDEGNYRCVIKTPIGVVLGPVITVSVAPLTDTIPTTEVKAKSGEPVLLECQIASLSSKSSLSDLQFTWIRSDNVTITQELGIRYNILSTGTLAISNVSRRDAGEYKCIVKDTSSNVERVSSVSLVTLPGNDNVSSEPPKIIPTKSFDGRRTVLILDEDEYAILDCIASGIPRPKIYWAVTVLNDNGTITVHVPPYVADFRNSINISSELAPGTGRIYSCHAENGIGEPVSQSVQVFRLPALQMGPESYQYPAAKTVRFECKVPPLFSLVWYKNGQLLETGKGRVKVKGNELVVSNTIRNDSGFYQCEVIADDRVYAVGTARLLVNNNREAPDAPTAVMCTQRHPTSLTVSWSPPAKVEDIISFSIHYMPARGEELQRVVPPKVTSVEIKSLLPHTDYDIYIRSYSIKSASGQSEKVLCRTTEDVPVNKPPHVVVERVGPPSQVRLTWKPLSNREARGKIIVYKLQWRSADSEFSNVRYIDGNSQEFVITDLSIDQNYEFRLIPSTSVGWPSRKDSWPWIPITAAETNLGANVNSTKSDGYYDAPSLHLTVLNSTSVLVNWSEPPHPKQVHVKGFRITYSTKSERVNDIVFFGPITIYRGNAREYLFSNLAPGSTYEFYIQTWGDDWESALEGKFIGTFPDTGNGQVDNLPVVTGLQVHPVTSDEVRLKWDQPLSNSSEGYFYTVKYNKVDNSDVYYISSTRDTVEIKGLTPYTSYEFVVQLTMKDGRVGPYSQKIESRTLPGAPGVPLGLHWRVHNQSVVEIEWTAPATPNGLITKYWVEFRLNKSKSSVDPTTGNTVVTYPEQEWRVRSTTNTSIFLTEVKQDEQYAVRVKAETKAGVGEPSDMIAVRIFNRRPIGDQPMTNPQNDDPKVNPDQQTLGIIIGIGLSAVFIALCITIIVCRNKFFPLISRAPTGALYVNGNGHPPRAKRSLESLNCVEMKVLVGLTGVDGQHDTKGGHQVGNGNVPSATDPLLVHVSRNAPGRHNGREDETIPNCVH